MGSMDGMSGYAQGGWMVPWGIGGIAIVIFLFWFLAKRRSGPRRSR